MTEDQGGPNDQQPPEDWVDKIDFDGIGAWQDQERPRDDSPEWGRQRELVIPELEALKNDPRFGDAIDGIVAMNMTFLAGNVSPEEYQPMQRGTLGGLVAFMEEQTPIFAHAFGRQNVKYYCARHILARMYVVFGDLGAAAEVLGELAGRLRLQQPGPDNPSELLAGGKAIVPPEATDRHRRQVRDLQAARRPKQAPGATPGSHHASKRLPPPPDEECERAVAMWTEEEIGRPLAKIIDPALRALAWKVRGTLVYRKMYPDDHPATEEEICNHVRKLLKRGRRLLGLPPDDDLENTAD